MANQIDLFCVPQSRDIRCSEAAITSLLARKWRMALRRATARSGSSVPGLAADDGNHARAVHVRE